MLTKMYVKASCLFGDDAGATATEYAILVAFVALAIAVGAGVFGTALSDWFSGLSAKVTGTAAAGA